MEQTGVSLEQRERQRQNALDELQILDTPPEAGFDELTRLAALYFGTPIALVSLIDRDRQWFKSKVGLQVSQTPRDIAFCDTAIRSSDVLVVNDALADPRFANNPLVLDAPKVRFYAGAPLVSSEGFALGAPAGASQQSGAAKDQGAVGVGTQGNERRLVGPRCGDQRDLFFGTHAGNAGLRTI